MAAPRTVRIDLTTRFRDAWFRNPPKWQRRKANAEFFITNEYVGASGC
jgi:hypothetical protein